LLLEINRIQSKFVVEKRSEAEKALYNHWIEVILKSKIPLDRLEN